MADKNTTGKHCLISPSDIRKFVYCPYQWYYEKTTGREALRALYKARNASLGLTNSEESPFQKGAAFHRDYDFPGKRGKMRLILRFVMFLLLVFTVCAFYVWFRGLI